MRIQTGIITISDRASRGLYDDLGGPALKKAANGYGWEVLSEAWNQGIDSHLEALTERSTADASTGQVLIHPEELHVLVRRLAEADSEEAHDFRGCILASLDIEEI